MPADDVTVRRGPGVLVPPPLLYGGALALGLVADVLTGASLFSAPWRWLAGGGLILAGLALVTTAMREFARARTAVEVWKPTSALVTTGPYTRSRNPIYVGLTAIYAGLGVALDAPWVLLLLPIVLVVLRYGVIAREERYLETLFGEAYRRYRGAVRRWF